MASTTSLSPWTAQAILQTSHLPRARRWPSTVHNYEHWRNSSNVIDKYLPWSSNHPTHSFPDFVYSHVERQPGALTPETPDKWLCSDELPQHLL
jgi:hypothetical protein